MNTLNLSGRSLSLLHPDNKLISGGMEESKEEFKINATSSEQPTTKSVIDLKEYAPHLLESQKAQLKAESAGSANKDQEIVKIIQQLY